MAIYNNREVHIVGPNPQANSPASINVRYKDGTHENVKLSAVKFSKDEKESLKKSYPSQYEDVAEASNEDLDAVRAGVTPPSDPTFKEQAETKVRHQKQVEALNEQQKKAEEKAKADMEKQDKAFEDSNKKVG